MSGASATATSAQQVFISYRREESAAYAGRIYDSMVARFGEANVFMDVEMPPGVDFVDRIDEVLSGCAALIIVIGPRWPAVVDEDGIPRLQDPEDFVRREVAAALRRTDVTVIPALVGGAAMPRAEQLPSDLHPLTRRNALELSNGRWHYDVGRLHEALAEAFARPPAPGADGDPARTAFGAPSRPSSAADATRLVLEGGAVAAAAAFLGRWLADLTPNLERDVGKVAEVTIQRAVTWAVVGIALALWLGARTGNGRHGLALGLGAGLGAGALGGLIWALPVKLSDPDLGQVAANRWALVSLAATGAALGAMVGRRWQPPQIWAGLMGGLLGGLLTRLLLNNVGWEDRVMPALGLTFATLAAGVAVGCLAAIGAIALSFRSPAATG